MVNRYNPNIHNRRSIRLPSYDYAQAGAYFVTLCAHGWECLFGNIDNGAMVLNGYGAIVREEWLKSSEIRSEIRLGEYVIMPNHFHAIVCIVDHRGNRRGDRPVAPTGPTPQSIGALIAGFKSAVTKRINAIRNTPGISVWQRNYYEHIIRNETDFHRIAQYITDNPRCWREDSLNPANQTVGKNNAMNDTGVAGMPDEGTVGATGPTAPDPTASMETTGSATTVVGATGRSPLQIMAKPRG
jgi:REP element-mobilizing transposase RayT